MDDSVLVLQAQSGNQSSYEQLIRRYARLVWSSIYGIVDPSWNEDVVQETFIKGWQSLSDLREPDRFRGWILAIARNEALQHSMKTARHNDIIENIYGERSRTIAQEPVDKKESVDLNGQLHSALRQLPERYRLPLTLRYLEGLDYNKISNVLGLTDGSLRGLLNRGMRMLRQNIRIATTD